MRPHFYDRLGPLHRWLRAHVGTRWDDVYGEARAIFDSRTTAGRHILFGHLLGEVNHRDDVSGWRWFRFDVDRSGILRELKRPRGGKPRICWSCKAGRWANGRKILERGSAAFWAVPVFHRDASGRTVVAYRQAARLVGVDLAFWRSLSCPCREPLVWQK